MGISAVFMLFNMLSFFKDIICSFKKSEDKGDEQIITLFGESIKTRSLYDFPTEM